MKDLFGIAGIALTIFAALLFSAPHADAKPRNKDAGDRRSCYTFVRTVDPATGLLTGNVRCIKTASHR